MGRVAMPPLAACACEMAVWAVWVKERTNEG
jgi:hypothetical protein